VEYFNLHSLRVKKTLLSCKNYASGRLIIKIIGSLQSIPENNQAPRTTAPISCS
jgi:hypothetical protein